MFTGIVEERGEVVEHGEGAGAWRLTVRAPLAAPGTRPGDSVAVNGCCLTAVEATGEELTFDLLEETRRLTNLKAAAPGRLVNLERSLAADGRFGGHFVTGHIDGEGRALSLVREGKDTRLEIEAPEAFARYLVYKGCLAVDGVSLTVAEASGSRLAIWLIPKTLEATTLGALAPGDAVNLEFDLLAKYVERLLEGRVPA